MISFAFAEEQEDFRRGLAQFAHDVLRPGYRERASKTEFPWDIQRQLGSMGVLGIGLPEEYGGTGAEDPILLGLAAETLAPSGSRETRSTTLRVSPQRHSPGAQFLLANIHQHGRKRAPSPSATRSSVILASGPDLRTSVRSQSAC